MFFKVFFFLIVIALSTNSHAQWWVSGGNLIWPHGNVSITKGNLTVNGSYNLNNVLDSTIAGPFSGPKVGWGELTLRTDSSVYPAPYINLLGTADFMCYKIPYQPDPIWEIDMHSASVDWLAPSDTITVANGINMYFARSGIVDTSIKFASDFCMYKSSIHPYYGDLGAAILPGYNLYHFFGEGDYPSYFGGDLQADGDVIKFENLPPDSTGLSTGQLYFDSSGFIKRKF